MIKPVMNIRAASVPNSHGLGIHHPVRGQYPIDPQPSLAWGCQQRVIGDPMMVVPALRSNTPSPILSRSLNNVTDAFAKNINPMAGSTQR